MAQTKQIEKPKTPRVDAGAVCRLIMATAPSEDLVRAALGDATVESFPAVARAFGVKESTVRNTWRRDGMPGEAKRGPGRRGRFVLADIAIWLLQRGAAAEAGRAQAKGHIRDDATRAELEAITLESERLGLELRRAKVSQITGDLVARDFVRSEWNAGLGLLSNFIMGLPRDVQPTLCRKCAPSIALEMERQLRSALTQFAETTITQVSEATNGADDSHNRSEANGSRST